MRGDAPHGDRVLLAAGAIVAGLALASAIWWPRAALTGWLGAAVAFGALPGGALLLVMMMRLIPGAWGEELRLTAEVTTLLTPLAAAVFVPVVVGMGAIYPWLGDRTLTGFQRAWLAPLPFVLVSAVRFLAQWWLGSSIRRRRSSKTAAALGVVALPLMVSLTGVHWLESLDPKLASSAFGLQFLLREVVIAFATLLLLRLHTGSPPRRLGVLGGLLLTLLLLWAYFAFLPFFVIWSGNLPPGVGWYQARAGGWRWAAWAFAALNGIPLLALLFAPVRAGRRWLSACSLAVLSGQLVDLAWTTLPGSGDLAIATYAIALLGLAAVALASWRIALRWRVNARVPQRARA